MSQANIDIVKAGVEAWNRGDFEGSLTETSPDIVWRTSGVVPDLEKEYRGHAGVLEFWRAWTASWDHIQIDAERYVDLGDQVAVLGQFHAGSRGQISVDQPIAFLFTVKDGRLSEFQSYWEQDEIYSDVDRSLLE